MSSEEFDYYHGAAKLRCEREHLFFTRYFFKQRQNIKFIVNWHHQLIADTIQGIIDGTIKNVIINVAPGSSKTEIVVVNLIARGLAINPHSRFLHLSYSDDLASLNSHTAREIIKSDEYQKFWPLKIASDTKSKSRWNVLVNDKIAGGVYATSLAGQITGFRAGHMTTGFSGAIILDDALKPEDGFSRVKLDAANRKLLTTVKSRRANPDTPIILIMQRIAESDPVGFIKAGNLQGDWKHVVIPAIIDDAYVDSLDPKYRELIERNPRDDTGRFSYWPYKEPIKDLNAMERGDGTDAGGSRISRHVFASQYQQNPVALGGNLIKGHFFIRYKIPPKIKYRKIFADTAMKTAEHNDNSVFGCFGLGEDGRLYLLDLIKDKWEAPELERRSIAFWSKHKAMDVDKFGALREMLIEDKASGVGLIQKIRFMNQIPIKGIERNKDKYTRVMDIVAYIESGMICIPEDASFTNDFLAECEAFSADDSHDHDDQVDVLCDGISNMLGPLNKLELWSKLK